MPRWFEFVITVIRIFRAPWFEFVTVIWIFQSSPPGLVYETVLRRRCNPPKSGRQKFIPKLSFLQMQRG